MSGGVLAQAPVLGVYVHFPFCGVHCPYCDFAVDARADVPHDAYADAVIAELNSRARWFGGGGPAGVRRGEHAAGRPTPQVNAGDGGDSGAPVETASRPSLASLYFGGGTPGLWRPQALTRVIAAVLREFAAQDVAAIEITVEANPGEIEEAGLDALYRGGVNRLSLGAQSLDDRFLRVLGRNHDAASVPAAVQAARRAGIDNVSIDLMFGLPGQSMDDWRRTVEGALALRPQHVSAYALTIERGTPFGARARRGERMAADDDLSAGMQEWARDALAAAGLAQYEVSSYARPGKRAVHNSLYWSGAPYLGLGASAASFRPLADGCGWRFSNPRATDTYLRAVAAGAGTVAPAQFELRTRSDLENEAVWLALRTSDGLDRDVHARRFGVDPVASREGEVRACVGRGWLQVDEGRLRPTPAGLLFADEIATRLWRA